MKLKELDHINEKVVEIASKTKTGYYFGRFVPNTKVIFVAEMPTIPKNKDLWDPTDNFNLSHTDKKFIELLRKHGFGGCYITDLVKTSTRVRRPTEKEKETFLPILLEELRVLQPKYIIALGTSAFSILKKWLPGDSRIIRIWHPAHQRSQKLYETQIRNLAEHVRSVSDNT